MDAIEAAVRTTVVQFVEMLNANLRKETPEAPHESTAAPCREILAALEYARQVLADVADSQGRHIGVMISHRAFYAERQCREAVESLSRLIESP
jgi:hypothetical protein